MYTKYLFPHRFKKAGWMLLIIGIIWGLCLTFFRNDIPKLPLKVLTIYTSRTPTDILNSRNDQVYVADKNIFLRNSRWLKMISDEISDEIISIILIVGAIFVACSREKTEDEFIAKIRLESLLWATYINYLLLLFCIIFIYDLDFLWVMINNMFTLLIIFTFRFKFILYKSLKAAKNEK